MKAILEFDLPEDRDAHIQATKAIDYACELWDIDQLCRAVVKYEDEISKEELCCKIRDMIADCTTFEELQ
jgi:hypothetical protein